MSDINADDFNIRSSRPSDHNNLDDKENKFFHMMMRVVSFLAQSLLEIIAVALQKFGSMVENFLNGTTFQRKKSVQSEDYLSFIGHLDSRMDLNKEIKHGDPRYYPSLSMMAAKLVYENELVINKVVTRHWNMEFVKFYGCYNEHLKRKTTEAFIMHEKTSEDDIYIVAFRGTSAFDAYDWSTDVDYSWCTIDGMPGKIHRGFMKALGLKESNLDDEDYKCHFHKQIEQDPEKPLAYYVIRDKLKEIMAENKRAKVIVTGHSLGGALATLFPAILAYHQEFEVLDKMEAIYTYGQPRVGNAKFGEFMKRSLTDHNIKYYRIVYGYDVVPRLPFDNASMKFKHFGRSIHFNSFYCGKIVEEPVKKDKKRVSNKAKIMKWLGIKGLMNFIVKEINAEWEVIRGFIIAYTAGSYYREGWLLLLIRSMFILFPCVVDHNPLDYVNATMLASQDLFKYYPPLTDN